ncbi:MAG: cupredoxin domain-containing protein [Casimicrobiaceae bacterium]
MTAVIASRRRMVTAMAAALLAGAAGVRIASAQQEPVVHILARRFTYSPDKITLARGVPVVLELESADVLMGFSVPDFGVRADIIPGQVTRVRIVADKSGTFPFLCDIFCGSGHESMAGTITVVG